MQINSSRPPLIPFPPPSTLLPRELQAQHQLFQQNHMRFQLSIQIPQVSQVTQVAAPEPQLIPRQQETQSPSIKSHKQQQRNHKSRQFKGHKSHKRILNQLQQHRNHKKKGK
jgi:hypothetical protein